MTDSRPGWTHYAQAELEGVKYDIFVAEREGKYLGAWSCLKCGDAASTTIASATPDEASAQAQINLCAHHSQAHRHERAERP